MLSRLDQREWIEDLSDLEFKFPAIPNLLQTCVVCKIIVVLINLVLKSRITICEALALLKRVISAEYEVGHGFLKLVILDLVNFGSVKHRILSILKHCIQ